MGREEERVRRIAKLYNSIKEATQENIGVDKKKLIATACIDFGADLRKVREYVNLLIDSGRVKEEGGYLWADGV